MRKKCDFPVISEVFQFQFFYQHLLLKQKTAAPSSRTAVFIYYPYYITGKPGQEESDKDNRLPFAEQQHRDLHLN